MLNRLKFQIKQALGIEFSMLERAVIEVENVRELAKLFDWQRTPLIDDPKLKDFEYPEDLNMRRLHDAQVVAGVMANLAGRNALEIGTAEGQTTVLIDGCHDAEFVYDNTCKALEIAQPGSYILWHDFSLPLVRSHHRIHEVCVGIEELYRTGRLRGRIYHLRDSWVGLYRVPER